MWIIAESALDESTKKEFKSLLLHFEFLIKESMEAELQDWNVYANQFYARSKEWERTNLLSRYGSTSKGFLILSWA